MSANVSSILFSTMSAKAESQRDWVLVLLCLTLVCFGLVTMTSASVAIADKAHDMPFYFLYRQIGFLAMGLFAAIVMIRIPMEVWNKLGPALLFMGILLLLMLLVPGVGKTVNGSTRWINLGVFNLQVSEFVKLLVLIFMASYLARHGERLRTKFSGVAIPMTALFLVAVLLLAEPDFGTTVVIVSFSLGLMLLAGMRLGHFLGLFAIVALALLALAKAAPYRWERVTSFLNPWADPFNSGFQLSQSLIAFGRGELFGVGLGSSVQKLFYLPEAYTDFIYAVLAEELGFLGAFSVIILFALFMWRALLISRSAEKRGDLFSAYLAIGIGLWFVFQAYVNMGVNMGVLPTKGLTLPLMSYGGSSLIVSVMALALLLRIDYENRNQKRSTKKGAGA